MFNLFKRKEATGLSAEELEKLLLTLYPCRVPFHLKVLHTRPRTHCGMYYPTTCRITVNDKGREPVRCIETAIHEYAHHLHYTEFGKKERKQAPHGREFWQIFGQLLGRARALGLYEDPSAPILVFPPEEEKPI